MNRGAVAGVAADVRSGSKADISACQLDVRFTPKSGHRPARRQCPLSAKSRQSASQQPQRHSITLSALTSTVSGTRQCERQQRHHHSERDPPVRYQPFILRFLLQARPRLFGRTRTIRAPIPLADWSLGQCLDMILAGLRTVHDNCKLLEEQGGNIHVS